MGKTKFKAVHFAEPTTPFGSVKDAATVTGLSQKFIRDGIKSGLVPHVLAGNKYIINIPALIEVIDAESKNVCTMEE